jgi:type IV pilus assembly protein PilW
MVAVSLSLLLLSGIVAIFMSSRASYETTDKLSRIQETGRFALDQIMRDIRSAGFVGCARTPTYVSTSLSSSTTLQWNFLDGPVRGFQSLGGSTWSPTLDTSVTGAANGSDVLVLRVPRRGAEPLRLTASMTAGTDDLTVPAATSGVRAGDIAMAYSCEAQAYFQVTSFAGTTIEHKTGGSTPGNASDDISYAFRENAEVIPVQTVIYYIRASSADAAIPALWRRIGLNAAEELAEGVEKMEAQFGVDTNGDTVVDSYVTADAVGASNWGNVYSVSVALLVRSMQAYGTDTDQQTYHLLDVDVSTPGDRHLRQVFTATANLRNRVPVN